MKIIIHDSKNLKTSSNDIVLTESKYHCIGCFKCWFKTPLECCQSDEVKDLGKLFLSCDELIIISKCTCGSYSSKVKKILERSLSYVEPYFEMRSKNIHHKIRRKNKLTMSVYFYGNITERSKQIAKKLIYNNAINYNATIEKIDFFNNIREIEKII